MKNYNSRKWLNPEDSHFTGSIVCFDGDVCNHGRPQERYTFVEIASCHTKVKLHSNKNDGADATKEFIGKLEILITELQSFQDYLILKEYP